MATEKNAGTKRLQKSVQDSFVQKFCLHVRFETLVTNNRFPDRFHKKCCRRLLSVKTLLKTSKHVSQKREDVVEASCQKSCAKDLMSKLCSPIFLPKKNFSEASCHERFMFQWIGRKPLDSLVPHILFQQLLSKGFVRTCIWCKPFF